MRRNAKRNRAPLRHAMFYGPPGTGKTMVAQRLARHCGLDFAIMSGGDVVSGTSGVALSHLAPVVVADVDVDVDIDIDIDVDIDVDVDVDVYWAGTPGCRCRIGDAQAVRVGQDDAERLAVIHR